MNSYCEDFSKTETIINNGRKPDFNNLLKVLRKEKPERPTLFELFISDSICRKLTCNMEYKKEDPLSPLKLRIDAYRIAGYDFTTITGSDFYFETKRHKEAGKHTISLNGAAEIFDRESFENYSWKDPEAADYSRLEGLSDYLPEGMKLLVRGSDGVFETVLKLVGYNNLCYMLIDEPELVQDIFNAVGSRYLRYYEICSEFDSVGALAADDDWGFNTQTFLSVNDMKKYVVPWHKKIAEAAHASGKPIILHSCGNIDVLMDNVINDIKYDAKHSFQDNIMPVEEVYEKLHGKIAILGGIDVDFLCRSTPEKVYYRACSILEQTMDYGGYALGSGNSIPEYVPVENYLAMISAALINKK